MSRRRTTIAALASLLLPPAIAPIAHAYDPITWNSIDGGGAAFATAGGGYRLGGTIGQHDAGALTSGAYRLGGGFWFGGSSPVSGVTDTAPPAPTFRFFGTAPNPVRLQSRLSFDLPAAAPVSLVLFDVTGRVVQRQDFGLLAAGHQERTWQATDAGGRPLSGGVYFLRLEAGRERAVRKTLVLR